MLLPFSFHTLLPGNIILLNSLMVERLPTLQVVKNSTGYVTTHQTYLLQSLNQSNCFLLILSLIKSFGHIDSEKSRKEGEHTRKRISPRTIEIHLQCDLTLYIISFVPHCLQCSVNFVSVLASLRHVCHSKMKLYKAQPIPAQAEIDLPDNSACEIKWRAE